MKCWNEIQEDAFSYFAFFIKTKANEIIGSIPNLSVFSVNSSMINGSNDKNNFLDVCSNEVAKVFSKDTLKNQYKLYLFANIEVKNKNSRIEKYKKVWKLLQSEWHLQEFRKGPEIEVNLGERIFYSSIAEFSLDNISTALEIIARNPQRYTIVATRKNNILTEEFVKKIFNISFERSKESQYATIDYFSLCLNIGEEDIVFRWGDSSEEAELALIFEKKMLEYFQYLAKKE